MDTVAEVEGLYGPFTLAERVIQQLWSTQKFTNEQLKSSNGLSLEVIDPGSWNHLEGPDFKAAKIRVGERLLQGDIEIHLYAEDWLRHGHSRDSNYQNVILHVSLFAPKKPIDLEVTELILLPYLEEDLETLALNAAMKLDQDEPFTNNTAYQQFLKLASAEEQANTLREKAKTRWLQKCKYAKIRLDRYSWDESCHQLCLEVLGYRRNRAPMSRLALAYPIGGDLNDWTNPEKLYDNVAEHWRLRGLRPANHPLKRLHDYSRLLELDSNWPQRLMRDLKPILENTKYEAGPVIDFRKTNDIKKGIQATMSDLLGVCMGESRLNTFCCDGLWPLFAAELMNDSLYELWYAWFAGDISDEIQNLLRESKVKDHEGVSHANGFYQGILQMGLES